MRRIIRTNWSGARGGGALFPVDPVSNFNAIAGNGKIELTWTDPGDLTTTTGIVIAEWAGTKIVRNAERYPQSVSDGTLVLDSTARNQHSVTPYVDDGLENGQTYYYQAFTRTTDGVVNWNEQGGASAIPVALQSLSDLPVGTLVSVPVNPAHQSRFGTKIIFKVADKNRAGYPVNSITLITNRIIQIMCFDGKEATNPDLNRKNSGNNRFLYANILQWMNSNSSAGMWYVAQHAYDAPPNANTYSGAGNHFEAWAGFLQIFPENFVNSLMTTSLLTARNIVTDGGSSEIVTAKMFFASTTEAGLANENNIAEGSKLSLFSDDTSRLAYPTAECIINSNGYANAGFGTGTGWHWWLRTPNASQSHYARHVNASGASTYSDAYYGFIGLRPLCNLPGSILVSPIQNPDGSYDFIL